MGFKYRITALCIIAFACCNSSMALDRAVAKGSERAMLDSGRRWTLEPDGIRWRVGDSHEDHLEFSGEQVSAIVYYGADKQGKLTLDRKLVWPLLRTVPNDTHASLIHDFPLTVSPQILLDGRALGPERLQRVDFDGVLTLHSQLTDGLSLTRSLSPGSRQPLMVERLTLTNSGKAAVEIDMGKLDYRVVTPPAEGVYGAYTIAAHNDVSGHFSLKPGGSLTSHILFSATKAGQTADFDAARELQLRREYVAGLKQDLQLETPDPVLNRMFDFAKLRAAESIFRTKGGLMHGPGGGRYYAAIWANDQAEYANPFFPFLGNDRGNASAINSFRLFAGYMNADFKPIPSSIIAEGTDYWNGAGDRGDCAMLAYGASRFALAYGQRRQAETLLPLIDWCLDFGFRKITADGVIASDSDELEGRFPAGEVNLSTNMLTYGALISAAHLNHELGRESLALDYRHRAELLAGAMESYFGARVQGFDTYRYYPGNDKLRAWIALPLTMGIFDRKQGTLDALLSEQLWSENGIYSEAGSKTFWDRATLYAFRGIFAAGETDTAMRYFQYYSRKRLLGEHVPYAVEAWPEGNQRHLSAESALYARVVTEGIFGIEPTGFKRFTLSPYLPSDWNRMCLKHIRAFDDDFDICVERRAEDAEVTVRQAGGRQQKFAWRGQEAIEVKL